MSWSPYGIMPLNISPTMHGRRHPSGQGSLSTRVGVVTITLHTILVREFQFLMGQYVDYLPQLETELMPEDSVQAEDVLELLG